MAAAWLLKKDEDGLFGGLAGQRLAGGGQVPEFYRRCRPLGG
jgi:hypothetical protein